MARTAEQNKQWWLDRAAQYDKEAASPASTAAQQLSYARRAAQARAHAETYVKP